MSYSKSKRVSAGAYIQRRSVPSTASSPVPWTTLATLNQSLVSSWTMGDAIPGYKRSIKEGIGATTTLTGAFHDIVCASDGYATVTEVASNGTWSRYELRGCLGLWANTPSAPTGIELSSVKGRVIQTFNRKLISSQTALRGLVTAGEASEAARMINSRAKALNRGMFNWLEHVNKRASRWRRIGRRTQELAQGWLERSFGWLPLVADIDAGAKALSRIIAYRVPRDYIKSISDSYIHGEPNRINTTWGVGPLRLYQTRTSYDFYSYKLYGLVMPAAESFNANRIELGISLNEFVPTVWELIPYSFLVDYFLNIGAVIDGLCVNTAGLRWINQGTDKRRLNVTAVELLNVPTSGLKQRDYYYAPASPFTWQRREIERRAVGPWALVPPLTFSVPGLSTKWLNMAALAITSKSATKALLGKKPIERWVPPKGISPRYTR